MGRRLRSWRSKRKNFVFDESSPEEIRWLAETCPNCRGPLDHEGDLAI
jgi:hypothetical protein